MGAYKYIEELWRRKQGDAMRYIQRLRCWEYRQQSAFVRLRRPSRVERARRVGYKSKQGFVVFRMRVRRGGRKRPNPKGIVYGKPKHQGVTGLKAKRNLRSVAEERVGRRASNLRVFNSYWVAQDATYKFFEVICIDPNHKTIRNDPRAQWIVSSKHKHREMRGLTSAGKKGRGIQDKSGKDRKCRGSQYSSWKKHNSLSLRRYR